MDVIKNECNIDEEEAKQLLVDEADANVEYVLQNFSSTKADHIFEEDWCSTKVANCS